MILSSMIDIAQITHGSVLMNACDAPISRIVTDTRNSITPQGSLFVALKGARSNGHHYLQQAYEKGLRHFMVQETPVVSLPGSSIVLVENTWKALQALAAHHRKQFNIPVIGITGSNGKTVVKEWLNTLLADDHHIVRSPKSYNSQLGVPLSVWNMDASHSLAIFEAGISEPGEMELLGHIIQPTIGILTNMGSAHSEHFLNRRQHIGEKMHLFDSADIIILPEDGDVALAAAHWSKSKHYIIRPSLENCIKSMHKNHTTMQWLWEEKEVEFDIRFNDHASLENALTCILCMLVLKYPPSVIQDRLPRLDALQMRLQLVRGNQNCSLINDAYSNDLQSLEIALQFTERHATDRNRSAIISEILQSGLDEDDLHHHMAELISRYGVQQLYAIGSSFEGRQRLYQVPMRVFVDTASFLQNLPDLENETILIKGARSFQFERIVEALEEKSHDTTLEIDLNAIRNNLNFFRNKLPSHIKCMAMVKAFGYGAGTKELASTLQFNHVDYLAVAYVDEGVELRKSGISMPIMVMNPEQSSWHSLIRHHLEPEIYSFRVLDQLLNTADKMGLQQPVRIHIKWDTGMHRLGFVNEDIDTLIARLKSTSAVKVESLFTHLAAADDPNHDAFTQSQLTQLSAIAQHFRKELNEDIWIHALNSAGIERFPAFHMDLVRLGIGLYGISAIPAQQVDLQVVSSL
ncbi:MAG: bifunctional UDP-N-acetylmuramoyl-tripeptide:D-alanyl-D-alanine ligase/alanine racemase, partial [Flavobacteriales bacterium]